jgi:hypothetical protein
LLALLVSYAIIAYIFVPAALFRLSSSSILKNFQRTRAEEIAFSVYVSIIPLLLAGLIVWGWSNWHPQSFAGWDDYREILAASYSEQLFGESEPHFWRSAGQVFGGQFRFLALLWPFSFLEGVVFFFLIQSFGQWRDNGPLHTWLAERLLGSISEWFLLLTTANFPKQPERRVAVDVLIAEDHLYQGFMADYFLDANGELSGLLLTEPRRFDRAGYLAAKGKDESTRAEEFWRDIPGNNLYLPRDKMLNLNLRYPPKEEQLPTEAANNELASTGLTLRIEPIDEPGDSG